MSMLARCVVFVFAALALCSCVTVPATPVSSAAKRTPAEIAASCKVERDDHRGLDLLYTQPYRIAVSRFPYVTENAEYRLVASRDLDGTNRYQIDIRTARDSDWAFYREAIDAHHNRLPLVVDDQRVDAVANTHESFHIDVDRAYLDRHTTIGLDILISGQRNEFRLVVPDNVVEGFLSATDSQWP